MVDLEGFEGPIDLLLSLAREQKVDLARISILALAEQYLAYIQQARDLQLELAADYLVMAAWLAYLKSRLLLPEAPDDDEPSGAELAAALAERLRPGGDPARRGRAADPAAPRLRAPAARLSRGHRGASYEPLSPRPAWLLQAYVDQRLRATEQRLTVVRAPLFRVEDALRRLTNMLGGPDWRSLLLYLPPGLNDELLRRSALAAHLGACLELAREGMIELSQAAPFGPIYLRRKR